MYALVCARMRGRGVVVTGERRSCGELGEGVCANEKDVPWTVFK